MSDSRDADRTKEGAGLPRWVRVSLIVAAVIAVVAALFLVLGGGEHGPGQHMGLGLGVPVHSLPGVNSVTS